MPVVTAAVLALGAAIATTTVATVATAVVAVSVAVGVAGLAVTAIGAVTGNKDLLKVGEIMGYVGLAGGLAGGLIGGVGGLAAGTGFFQGAAGAYTGAAGYLQQGWDKGIGSLFQPTVGAQVAGPVSGVQAVTPSGVPLAPGVAPTGAEVTGAALTADSTLAPATAAFNAAPTAGMSAGANASQTIANAVATPAAGLINAPAVAQVAAPAVPTALKQPWMTENFLNSGIAAGGASVAAQNAANALSSMPDWMKYSVMTSGMQALSGAAAGWFQGASAEERLEFEKLVNAQRQGQVELTNQRGAYAPNLSFTPRPGPAGVINTVGA